MRSIFAVIVVTSTVALAALASCGKGGDVPAVAAPTSGLQPASPAQSATAVATGQQEQPCDDTASAGKAAGGGTAQAITGGEVRPPTPPMLPKGPPPRDTGDPPPRPPCKR